jgi:hypothetical protein
MIIPDSGIHSDHSLIIGKIDLGIEKFLVRKIDLGIENFKLARTMKSALTLKEL